MKDRVRIRRATLVDLPLLLRYRRTMAEEMDGADEAAVNRMIAALETLSSRRYSGRQVAFLDCRARRMRFR